MNKYLHLLRITTSGMLIVLSLLFWRTATSIVAYFNNPTSYGGIGVLAIADILLVLLAVLATVTIAHAEHNVPYKPLYFLLGLLLVTFPLFVAVECVYAATLAPGLEDIDTRLFGIGMYTLAFTFFVLVCYLLQVALGELPEGVRKKQLLMIAPFHIIGGLTALAAGLKPSLALAVSIGGLVLSVLFLFFYWALRVRFSLQTD